LVPAFAHQHRARRQAVELEHAALAIDLAELQHAVGWHARENAFHLCALPGDVHRVPRRAQGNDGGHGLDDLAIDGEPDYRLLAFLHVAEKSAAGRFEIYRQVVDDDPSTRAIFEQILRDEVFHMNYTYTQLARISPRSYRRHVWWARASRLWKRYLRIAAAVAGLFGATLLTLVYFIVLPPFVWLAQRAERVEGLGWRAVSGDRRDLPTSQY